MRMITFLFTVNNVPFFVASFEYSLSEQIYNFLRLHFYMIFTEFFKNSEVVFSDFLMKKNEVAL